MKKWLAVLLAGVMTVSLAACGNGGQSNNGGNGGKNTEEVNQEAKQHVYRYEELSLGDIQSGSSARALSYRDDKIYALFDCWGETQYTALYMAKTDGTEEKTVRLEQPEMAEGDSSYVSASLIAQDGKVYLVQSVNTLVDAENYTYDQKFILQCFDMEGNLLWSQPILEDAGSDTDYVSVQNMGEGMDGGVELLVSDSNGYRLVCLDGEGQEQKKQELGTNDSLNLNTAMQNKDGTWLVLSYNNDYTALNASVYDAASGSFGEQVSAPAGLQNYQIQPGLDGRLLLVGQDGTAVWNLKDTEITEMMNCIDSDLNASSIAYAAEISDTQFVAIYSDAGDMSQHLALFTKVKPEDVPDRQTLVLGGFYIGSDVRTRVIDFNKNNSTYKISVKDYSSDVDFGNIDESLTQLNNDILAGNMPDILVVNDNIQMDNLVKKGLLADIDALIAGDEELSKVAFMDNVFDAYRIDGKLYQVIPFFQVNTFIGKKSVLGDITGWNMEEFMTYASGLGEGQSAFGEVTRDGFLSYALQYGGGDYIDSDTGKCHFDSDEFVNLLTYAATLPEKFTYDEDYDWTVYANQYRSGQTMLMPLYLNDFSSLSSSINGSFGEDVAYAGFPTADKNGSAVIATESYAISAKSASQDAAWEFARYYLTEEYQTSDSSNGMYGMPVEKNAFMAMARKALEKPYYLDENGQKVEYDETYYINDEEIVLPPLTEEQLNQAVSFVESIGRTTYQNSEVLQIINEEVPAFFEGQKSAKDVAGIIQNRVQLYLDENS